MDRPDDACAQAFDAALRILARRNHSRVELRQKLRQRRFTPPAIDAALARCERLGYVDDSETAAAYFRELVRKGFGGDRIRLEMNRKGLSGEAVDGLIEAYTGGPDEAAAASHLLARRMGRFDREADPRKRREKIFRFMLSRGFSADTIQEALRNAGTGEPSD